MSAAIRLSFLGVVGDPRSDVVINENNIGFVGSVSFVGDGLLVDSGSHVGTLNAECNWWGSSTGPTNPNNPGGLGKEVVGNTDFTTWLTAPTPVGVFIGGASTPGKVTGGDQIEGDPFSIKTTTYSNGPHPEQPPPEQLQPCRLPVPSHPSCPCAAVRAGSLPAASSAGQPLARGVRADPRRGQLRAGWQQGGMGWADAGGGKGRLIFLYSQPQLGRLLMEANRTAA